MPLLIKNYRPKINNKINYTIRRFRNVNLGHNKTTESSKIIEQVFRLNGFLDRQTKKNKIVYSKKDPMKYIRKINYEDDGEDLSDVKPYSHIKDSAKYIHDLRRGRIK